MSARDGEEDVESPGTLERRRLGGVVEVWMSDDELISSASWELGSRIELYLARLTTLSRALGGVWRNLTSLDRSRSEMKEAISSSSVLPLPELVPMPSLGWLIFSFELELPRPELVLLSAALPDCDVNRFCRLAKELTYRLPPVLGDVDPDDATAVSCGVDGARNCCCGRVLSEACLLWPPLAYFSR